MPNYVADDMASINQRLLEIEREKTQRYNPKITYDPETLPGQFIIRILGDGHLLASPYWQEDGIKFTEVDFDSANNKVKDYVTWLDTHKDMPEKINHYAIEMIRKRSSGNRTTNCLVVFCRLRLMGLI